MTCPRPAPLYVPQVPAGIPHPAEEKVGAQVLRFFNAPSMLGFPAAVAASRAAYFRSVLASSVYQVSPALP